MPYTTTPFVDRPTRTERGREQTQVLKDPFLSVRMKAKSRRPPKERKREVLPKLLSAYREVAAKMASFFKYNNNIVPCCDEREVFYFPLQKGSLRSVRTDSELLLLALSFLPCASRIIAIRQ